MRLLALMFGLAWASLAQAQTPPDKWLPAYQTYIAPADPSTGKLISKGEVAITDVRIVCAGKGNYRSVKHAGGTYSQNHRLSQNDRIKRQVMAASGVPWKDRAHYEDDHYCPLALGCSDNIENRWAQPRFGNWHAAKKDKLETAAVMMVCAGDVSLKEAQAWFQTRLTPDWRVPYCAEFQDDPDCAKLKP